MSSPTPHLDVSTPRGAVRGVVLVMHGGREASTAVVRPTQLAVLRMLPIARAIGRAGRPHGLAVARLRFGVRGWNGELRSPVADARWALEQLTDRFDGAPIALVGHSMGGRTALHVAGHPAVTTVVGLAPWIESGDPRDTVTGRRVLLIHGTGDRITDPRRSKRFVREVEPVAEAASFIGVAGDKHAMLRRPGVWNSLASGYLLAAMCALFPESRPVPGLAGDGTANVLRMALAGQTALVV